MLRVTGSCWNLVENVDFFRQTIDTVGLGMQVLNWLLWIVAPMSVPLSKSLHCYSHFSWMPTISWSGWDLEGKEPVSSVFCLCSSVCDRIQARLAWRWAQKLDDNIMSLFLKSSFSIQSPWYFPVSWGFPIFGCPCRNLGFSFWYFFVQFLWLCLCRGPVHQKRPWCWERLRAKGEEGGRGWDGWMASPTQWTWVWANSGRQGSQAYCSPWGLKELDTTEQLNNNNTQPNG